MADVDGPLCKSGDSLSVPQEIFMYHANWTIGIQNKIAQLDYVKRILDKLLLG